MKSTVNDANRLEKLIREGKTIPQGTYMLDRDVSWRQPTVCPFTPGEMAVIKSKDKMELLRVTRIEWRDGYDANGAQLGWQIISMFMPPRTGSLCCSTESLCKLVDNQANERVSHELLRELYEAAGDYEPFSLEEVPASEIVMRVIANLRGER